MSCVVNVRLNPRLLEFVGRAWSDVSCWKHVYLKEFLKWPSMS